MAISAACPQMLQLVRRWPRVLGSRSIQRALDGVHLVLIRHVRDCSQWDCIASSEQALLGAAFATSGRNRTCSLSALWTPLSLLQHREPISPRELLLSRRIPSQPPTCGAIRPLAPFAGKDDEPCRRRRWPEARPSIGSYDLPLNSISCGRLAYYGLESSAMSTLSRGGCTKTDGD